MHLVHLTASSLFGGPERQMLGLARALPSEYRTTFLSFAEGGRCEPFLSAVRADNFAAHALKADSPHLRATTRELTDTLRALQAEVLLVHGYKSNILGRIAARRLGVPIISVSRGWTGEDFKVRCYETLDRWHLRYMDRVVCVSSAQAAKVLRTGVPTGKIRVIRNAARLDCFAERQPQAARKLMELGALGSMTILAAGRLSPEKGFHVLVEAARLVSQQCPNTRFVLFGEGSERPRLEGLIRQAGLQNTFHMPGFRPDVDEFIPWADVVVLPSLTEGLPNVALEASAAGVPVVATAVGGTPEVIADDETGFLVPSGDAVQMAQRLLELARDPLLCRRFGQAGRARMASQFTFAAQAKAYETLFHEVLGSTLENSTRKLACS